VPAVLKLALLNVLRHRRRSWLAIGAIAFGTVAMLLAGGFIEWIFVNFREYSIHSHLGHIQVTRQGYRAGATADPFAFLLPDDRETRKAIEAEPGVLLVAPRLEFNGLVSAGETTLSFLGEGVDPEKELTLSQSMTISAGLPLAADDPAGAILGDGLAANLGVKPGDTLVLLATTAAGATNAAEVKVRGTFYTVTKAYDDVALRLPLVIAQKLLRVDGAHVWVVLLRDTAQTPAMLAALRARFTDRKMEFTPWWQLADMYNKTVELFSKQLGAVRAVVGLIIVLSISNTMIMSVLERTWEIGTSMALGARRRDILLQFLAEGALLGVFGAACGLVLGALLALAISAIGIPMPPPPGMSHGFTGGILLTYALVSGALGIAVGTTLVATVYPARRAARLSIVDALRHNH
jgi:putative ABC transport system permease protein